MKLRSLCSATAFLLLATLGSTQAQSLLKDAVLSGKLYTQDRQVVIAAAAQPEGQIATPIVVTPLTIRALLDVFGYSDIKANTVGLFIDNRIITLAKKDGGFVYGTLVSLSSSGAAGIEDKSRALYASSASLLNDTLTGEGLITYKPMGKKAVAVKYGFTGHATRSDATFVIKGTVSYRQASSQD